MIQNLRTEAMVQAIALCAPSRRVDLLVPVATTFHEYLKAGGTTFALDRAVVACGTGANSAGDADQAVEIARQIETFCAEVPMGEVT